MHLKKSLKIQEGKIEIKDETDTSTLIVTYRDFDVTLNN